MIVTGFRREASMSPNPRPRWHAVPDHALAWRDWGGEVVVFNQATGSTHLLGGFAAEVLLRLGATKDGATVDMLAARLTDDPSLAADGQWIDAIAGALCDFARLGLARREQP